MLAGEFCNLQSSPTSIPFRPSSVRNLFYCPPVFTRSPILCKTERQLAVPAIENKLVQQAVVTILNQIYEEDFLASVCCQRQRIPGSVNWSLVADTSPPKSETPALMDMYARSG